MCLGDEDGGCGLADDPQHEEGTTLQRRIVVERGPTGERGGRDAWMVTC